MRSGLVVVDESRASAQAVVHAADLAQRDRARLTLIWVLEQARSAGAGPYFVVIPEANEQAAQRALLYLAALVPPEVPLHTILCRGLVSDEIVRRANAAEHDAIVIGSGRTGFSVIGKCLSCAVRRKSAVPVITIRASGSQGYCCHRVRMSALTRSGLTPSLRDRMRSFVRKLR